MTLDLDYYSQATCKDFHPWTNYCSPTKTCHACTLGGFGGFGGFGTIAHTLVEVRGGAPVCTSLDTVHAVDTAMLGHAWVYQYVYSYTFATIGQKEHVINLAAAICQSVKQFYH